MQTDTAVTTQETPLTELFAGLDSFLTKKDKEENQLSIDTETNTINVNPAIDKAIADKKKEEVSNTSKEDTDIIEVDATTPTTTRTVDTNTNKEVKETSSNTITESVKEVSTDDNTDTQEADALKSFVSVLKEQGVLEGLDIESYDGTIDGLKQGIFNEAKAMADEYKETLPPVIKYLIDNYEEDVPLDQLINIKSNEIRYSSIDKEKLKEDTGLQKELYKEFLKKTTNFSDTKITKEVTRLEETGELSNEVDEALPELVKLEKTREKQILAETKAAKEASQKQNEETLKNIKKTADSYKGKEIVPGLKLTDKDVLALNKSLTTPVGYDNNGTPISEIQKLRSEDPIGFELKLNYIAKLTKGFTDYSVFIKSAKTAVAKEVEIAATSTSTYKGGKSNIVEEDKPKDILSSFGKWNKTRTNK